MSCRVEVRARCRAYPVVVCNHCGEHIERVSEGNAVWLKSAGSGATYDVGHTHKTCNAAFERAHPAGPGSPWMFNDLDYHWFMLLFITCYNAEEAKRKAAVLAIVE